MAQIFEFSAELRTDVGKGASRRLRRKEAKVPAILYGGGQAPEQITLSANALRKALENEAVYSHILTIELNGKKQQAVLKDIQRHPSAPIILHLDLLRVTADSPITMRVPFHFKGGEECPGVKQGGLISHTMTDVEIKCLPKDLPSYIEIDLSQLELNDIIHLSTIKLPKGVTLTTPVSDSEHDLPVVSVHIPRAAPIEEEVVAVTEEAAAAAEEGQAEEGKQESEQ